MMEVFEWLSFSGKMDIAACHVFEKKKSGLHCFCFTFSESVNPLKILHQSELLNFSIVLF